MVASTLSLTEFQELSALNAFLASVLPVGLPVIRGQVNRVAEPKSPDFVVYWPLRRARLSTNETAYQDNVVAGSIAGSVMTVTALVQTEGPLSAGMLVTDGTAGEVAANTVIVGQISGSSGGTGAYSVSPAPQSISGDTLYVGQRADLTPFEWTVQCDVHGPNAADNVQVVMSLFRSEVATAGFAASDYAIAPLYADEARQVPFINAEQAYESRWTVDLVLQVNPIIGTPQQFADELEVKTVDVDATYPP